MKQLKIAYIIANLTAATFIAWAAWEMSKLGN